MELDCEVVSISLDSMELHWSFLSWDQPTRRRRLIGSPKLQFIVHKRDTKSRSHLRKLTYKDKGSYESSPPCSSISLDLMELDWHFLSRDQPTSISLDCEINLVPSRQILSIYCRKWGWLLRFSRKSGKILVFVCIYVFVYTWVCMQT